MKKFLPYILILVILVGLFGPGGQAQAQGTTPVQWYFQYTDPDSSSEAGPVANSGPYNNEAACKAKETEFDNTGRITITRPCYASATAPGEPSGERGTSGSAFENNISGCAFLIGDFDDCMVKLVYYLFYVIPSFLLNLIGNFFNVIITLALSSVMYTGGFIAQSWAVTRDVSNIFFIIILLYAALQIILGIGHDTKKLIANVIIMALLINFSMFFTKIIIDSSNILALIFYNKINVETSVIVEGGKPDTRPYVPVLLSNVLGVQEKDLSGGLVSRFDVTKFMTEEFFQKVKRRPAAVPVLGAAAYVGSGAAIGSFGGPVGAGIGAVIGGITYGLSYLSSPEVPPGLMIGIILIAGLIMFFAAYAFFVASISFLGRLIELWVLIIFSPFAFMSFAMPSLKNKAYLGWDAWLARLLKTSFMAPIFMFFLYFIFRLVQTNIFADFTVRQPADQGMIEAMILVVLPGLIILFLLLQATKFAKEGSGQLGDMLTKSLSVVTGIVGGLAIGGAARGLQGTAGKWGKMAAESDYAKKLAENKNSAFSRFAGRSLQSAGMKAAGSSFDARKGVLGAGLKVLSSTTGLKLDSGLVSVEAGGYMADLKKRNAERAARNEVLKGASSAKAKEELRDTEVRHHELAEHNSEAVGKIDRELDAKRKRKADFAVGSDEEKAIAKEIAELNARRSAIKNATEGTTDADGNTTYNTHNGNISQSAIKKTEENAEAANNKYLIAMSALTIATEARAQAEAAAAEAENNSGLAGSAEAIKEAREKLSKAIETETKAVAIEAETATEARGARDKVATARTAGAAVINRGEKLGFSQNDFEDDLIPDAKLRVQKIEHHVSSDFAKRTEGGKWKNRISFYNRGERRDFAQNLRKGAKMEKPHKEDGGHRAAIGDDVIANFVTDALKSTPSAAKADAGGGGAHPPAH